MWIPSFPVWLWLPFLNSSPRCKPFLCHSCALLAQATPLLQVCALLYLHGFWPLEPDCPQAHTLTSLCVGSDSPPPATSLWACFPHFLGLESLHQATLYVCPTLCDLMDCSMPGLLVLHHLPEPAQTHVTSVEWLWFKLLIWCVCVQLRLTLCELIDSSLPGSSVHGIFQARISIISQYHFNLIFAETQEYSFHCFQC